MLKNVSYLDGHYIPALELGNGENTLKNATTIATFTKSGNESIAIIDLIVKNGYITFLTDINMWMGLYWTEQTTTWKKCADGSQNSDSKQFMKNLLNRSIDNIEAVSNMNKIFYTGLENSHYEKDSDGNEFTNPSAYTSSTDSFVLNNPIKEGYEFVGWSGTGLSGLSKSVTVAKGSTGDRSYTANWHKHEWVYSAKGSALFAYCKANNLNSNLCSYLS